jgi:hypothetical protein
MSITKNGDSLVFDQMLPTSSGAITGVLLQPHIIPHAHVGVYVNINKVTLSKSRLKPGDRIYVDISGRVLIVDDNS